MSISLLRKANAKGQAATEFLIFFGVIVLILLVLAIGSQRTITDMRSEMDGLSLKDSVDSMKGSIDMVYTGGDGFSANVTLPETIDGKDYVLGITNGFLTVNVSGNVKGARLMTDNITGILIKGKNTITNVGNVLVIS